MVTTEERRYPIVKREYQSRQKIEGAFTGRACDQAPCGAADRIKMGKRIVGPGFRYAAHHSGGAGDAREHLARRNRRGAGSRRAESDCRKAGGHKPAACPEEERETEADPLAADRTVRSRGRDFRSPARAEQSLSGLGLQRSGNRRRRRGFPCVRVAVCPAGAGRSHRGGRWNCSGVEKDVKEVLRLTGTAG